MADPVAFSSTLICTDMMSNPDDLVACVKHFGKVQGSVSHVLVRHIDCEGITISYSLESGGSGCIHVKFDPPLSGPEEAKPRLLAMKNYAQRVPGIITSFRLPLSAMFPVWCLFGAAYFTWAPPSGTSLPFLPTYVSDTVFAPAHALSRAFGFQPCMTHVLQFCAIIHAVESLYTWYLCRCHVKGASVRAAYLFATFIFGFPIWVDLKKRVREECLESGMKTE